MLAAMALWDYLFDSEYKQRDDIESLKATAGSAVASTSSLERRVGKLTERLGRLELTVEGVYRALESKGHITTEEFRDLLVQIDLEDGREDGRIGVDRSAKAPSCPACSRPINPKRTHCVFCHAELPERPRRGSRRR